eukprot:356118-Chlamydomonas_euryale.AAC.6
MHMADAGTQRESDGAQVLNNCDGLPSSGAALAMSRNDAQAPRASARMQLPSHREGVATMFCAHARYRALSSCEEQTITYRGRPIVLCDMGLAWGIQSFWGVVFQPTAQEWRKWAVGAPLTGAESGPVGLVGKLNGSGVS